MSSVVTSLLSIYRRYFSSSPSSSPSSSACSFSQTEAAHSSSDDNIWHAVLTADINMLRLIVNKRPSSVHDRGPVGETPLHMCLLYASPAHLELGKWIMDNYPSTITAEYSGTEYLGENVLHIAIIHQDFKTVQELVHREPLLLKSAATGAFFQRGAACYYGEYPFHFAVCTNQQELADFLWRRGAEVERRDTNGNNILHLLVIHNLPQMYSWVKQEWIKRKKEDGREHCTDLWLVPNNDGLTPFCLAAKINSYSMFSFLLEETRQMQWTYGPVSCYLYPLAELDLQIQKEGDTNAPAAGALELIMNTANVALLMHPRMLDLVKQKWERFARRIFFNRFIQVLIYLFLFTITTIVRQSVDHVIARMDDELSSDPSFPSSSLSPAPASWALCFYEYRPLLWTLETLVFAGAYYKGSREVGEIWNSGWRNYFSSSGSAFLENILSLSFFICMCFVLIFSLLHSPARAAFLALASITGWSYIFFFLLAFRLTGPMVVMIHQMLLNDVLRFLTIYLVFLMGFAQAFFILFESVGFSGFIISVKTCFVAMLGDFELDAFADTPYTAVSVGLLVVYVVTITILLLNLLIAMMGDTYEKINEQAEMQWHLERARIIFAIENEMSTAEREDPKNKYWTTVDGCRFLQVFEHNPNHFRSDSKLEEEPTQQDLSTAS